MSTVFGDLVEYAIGGGWGTEEAEPDSSSIGYVIRGTDIPRVAVGDVSKVPLRYHKATNLASRVLKPGDVVLEVSGGSKGQPVGRALKITDNILAKFQGDVICASFCKLVRIDPTKAEPGYVFRLLQAAYADGRLARYQVQSTGITNFKWKAFLEHFEVDLPARKSQQQIAAILDVFDELVENNRRRVEVLEEMARAIFRQWFQVFRYPGHEDVPLVDSTRGPIPEGWTVGKLGDLAKISSGKRPPTRHPQAVTGSSVPVVGASSVMAYTESALTAGRTLITGRVGTHGVVQRFSEPVWPSDNTLVLLADYYQYTYQVMLGIDYRNLNRGAAQPLIAQRDLASVPTLMPGDELLGQFERRAEHFLATADALVAQAMAVASMRDLLLTRLIAGQIDVPQFHLDAVLHGVVG
ncbi:MAG: restriction endonuclease subunit S [Propionicimonas sp.]